MKVIMAIAALLTASQVLAAASSYDRYICNQKCGFTSSTPTTVNATALSMYTAKSIMSDVCRWQRMHLQGDPTCRHTHYDLSKREIGARCLKGINTSKQCRADVRGVGVMDDKIRSNSFTVYEDSYDRAISEAKEKCRYWFRDRGIRTYRCDLIWYY